MEKKSFRILAIIFLILLAVVLFFILKDKPNTTKPATEDYLKFKDEYESVNNKENAIKISITENAPIKYLSYEELTKKIENKDNFVIYFGFPTCPWCRNIINVLLDTAKENNSNIYYINTRELKNSKEEYNAVYELLYDYLEENSDGVKTLYVPDVYFFKDGKIVGHHLGSVDSQTNPYVLLNDDQKKELNNIYQDLFNKLK